MICIEKRLPVGRQIAKEPFASLVAAAPVKGTPLAPTAATWAPAMTEQDRKSTNWEANDEPAAQTALVGGWTINSQTTSSSE